MREIRQTAILVNAIYFDASVEHVAGLLPPLQHPEDSFGVSDGYCALQRQCDGDDVFLFFRTRWTSRRGIQIYRLLENSPTLYSPNVFDLIHEGESIGFYEQLGYDVPWDTIVEIAWKDFTEFITKVITDSLSRLLVYHKREGSDRIVFRGDLRWVPTEYRESVDFLQEQQNTQ